MVYAVKSVETGKYFRLRKSGSVKVLDWAEAYSTSALANSARLVIEDKKPELTGKLFIEAIPVIE